MENTSSDFPTVQLETTHRQLFTVQSFLKETSFFVHFPTSIKLVNAILQVHRIRTEQKSPNSCLPSVTSKISPSVKVTSLALFRVLSYSLTHVENTPRHRRLKKPKG